VGAHHRKPIGRPQNSPIKKTSDEDAGRLLSARVRRHDLNEAFQNLIHIHQRLTKSAFGGSVSTLKFV
jgi:hypothetical protein